MRERLQRNFRTTSLVLFATAASGGFTRPVAAQNPEMQQKVADVKLAVATNKQALAQYTWVEQVTISLKGEQKKQEHFRVVMGPDGKPQKTSLDPPPSDDSSGGGRLKKHIVAKKKEEYKEYADQMKDLAQQYVPPDKDRLQQAYQQGNITLGPSGGAPTQIQLVIHNYVKPQDSMTLLFDKTQGGLVRLEIATYMDDPKDAMNLTVAFSRLPDGTNHVSNVVVNGVSKQMTVAIDNSSYQHL